MIKRREKLTWLIIFSLSLAIIMVGAVFVYGSNFVFLSKKGDIVDFSIKEHFLDSPAQLTLTKLKGTSPFGKIHYTLDGSTPTVYSPVYQDSIPLDCTDEMKVYTVKAMVAAGGKTSKVYTNTYFTGRDISSRFDCMVVSITTDSENLYDPQIGLLVGANQPDNYFDKIYDPNKPYIKENGNSRNRGPEWERPVSAEFFETDGSQVINQLAGLRITGDGSRDLPQKSLRLYARKIYDEEKSDFNYSFFGEDFSRDGLYMPITSYDQITLRSVVNGANGTYITDSVARQLAFESGLTFAPLTRVASIFLNGEYYGFTLMQTTFSEDTLKGMSQVNRKDNIVVLEGGEGEISNPELMPEQSVKEYYNLLKLSNTNFAQNPDQLKQTSDMVDYDDMIKYYAVEMFLNNTDWPTRNYKVWRYENPDKNEFANKFADGRWRFLIFDLDGTFGVSNDEFEAFDVAIAHGYSTFISSVLTDPMLNAKFANQMCDLISTTFSPANIQRVIDHQNSLVVNELYHASISKEWSMYTDLQDRDMRLSAIKVFAQNRQKKVMELLEKYTLARDRYTLQLYPCENAVITFNTVLITGKSDVFSGIYFKNKPAQLSVKALDGYKFSHWLIDGKRYTQQEISLDKNVVSSNSADIQAVVEPVDGSVPVITKIDAWAGEDFIVLSNPFAEEISLQGLYLSTNRNNLKYYKLNNDVIAPKQSYTIVCKNYAVARNDVSLPIATFNLKEGETLYLSNEQGEILDYVYIPDGKKVVSYIKDQYTGQWHFTTDTDF